MLGAGLDAATSRGETYDTDPHIAYARPLTDHKKSL